ncbi:MAG: hypothetical protein ABW034_01720 [Steroidobacteraceae bacterium]
MSHLLLKHLLLHLLKPLLRLMLLRPLMLPLLKARLRLTALLLQSLLLRVRLSNIDDVATLPVTPAAVAWFGRGNSPKLSR